MCGVVNNSQNPLVPAQNLDAFRHCAFSAHLKEGILIRPGCCVWSHGLTWVHVGSCLVDMLKVVSESRADGKAGGLLKLALKLLQSDSLLLHLRLKHWVWTPDTQTS